MSRIAPLAAVIQIDAISLPALCLQHASIQQGMKSETCFLTLAEKNQEKFMPLNQGSETVSSWMTIDMPRTPKLEKNQTADVCVVGAGIAGLTTAYLLAREGKKVCVIDHGEVGSGQTGKTTAQFSTSTDNYYYNLKKYFGSRGIKIIADSLKASIELVTSIVKNENIDCDLEHVPGFLFQNNRETDLLEKELAAAHEAGLADVKMADHAPFSSFNTGPCLCFPQQLQLHPLKYLRGLAQAIQKLDGKIYTYTHIDRVEDGDFPIVHTSESNHIKAKAVVVCTNSPINNFVKIHTKQAPYRSYVIGILTPKGSLPKALYWDTEDPYHYLRVEHENDIHDVLLVGGEDHKTGQGLSPHLCFGRLEEWARRRFPTLGHVLYRWSGQVMEPIDGIGFMGKSPGDQNTYIITGDSGDGMTQTTIGAMIVKDLILHQSNPWAELYKPGRITLRAAGTFLKENANVAAQYADWLSGENEQAVQDLSRQEGLILSHGLKKIAVYKDEEGRLEMHSAVCTHLGGILSWNSVEKSWDCPCHGSRFDCHGKVMEGPAVDNLKPFEEKEISKISVNQLSNLNS
jgi:glycine/D-amino acid oxidase-like deaminating enzyme